MDNTARPAEAREASALAALINLAGNALPFYLWQITAHGRMEPLEMGEQLIQREEGRYSYRHARVIRRSDTVAGVALAYRLDERMALNTLHEQPDPLIPISMLETCAPGSWHIQALTVDTPYRRQGIARALLDDALAEAKAHHCHTMSLIVNSENDAALKLYMAAGFVHKDRQPVIPYPGCDAGSDWLLLIRPTH